MSIACRIGPRIGRSLLAAGVVASSLLAVGKAEAQASDRWLADEAEASASLPAPGAGSGIEAATLACAAQRWNLTLALAGLGGGRSEAAATLRVDGSTFETRAVADGKTITVAMPRAAIEPLKAGLRMGLAIEGVVGGMLGELTFPLRGSRVAIEAVEERCSLRDMTGYTPVTFTPYSSYLNLARDLRKDDIDAFALATMSQPAIDAAMAEFGEGRRVLFTRMCGSSWYFGTSGCNITGFAPEPARPADEGAGDGQPEAAEEAPPSWRVVYDTENVHIYLDHRSLSDGWPDLATLPARGEAPARLWRWSGQAYRLEGELPDAE